MDIVPQNSTSIPMRTNPSYELWRKEGPVQSKVKKGSSTARLIVALIIIVIILVLITVALSVVAYRRLASERSQVLCQLNKTNCDVTAQFCSNVLQILTQLDGRIIGQLHCGTGLWWQVAHLNMTDPSQQCPSAWREYNTSNSEVRACGRPFNSTGSCAAKIYSIGHQYSRVCGRVIGYQVGSPDGFNYRPNSEIRLDGISITYGAQRNHVWSYVAGLNEMGNLPTNNCPCSSEQAKMPPPLIGNNYYCESGNPSNIWRPATFYQDDPLWDGQQCEVNGTCCNDTSHGSPPWFSVQLSAPTADVIEVRICGDESTNNEDTPIELIEIYVQ